MWNPDQYQKFTSERDRPFFDLLARVGAQQPRRVADLGCGPGTLTATLLERYPQAFVTGVDSSAAMLEKASHEDPRLVFRLEDLRDWHPPEAQDVIVSNAALQWVPDHDTLIPRLARLVAPDGWLAVQMPANFDSPTHTILHELCAQHPKLERLNDTPRTWQPLPWYVQTLSGLGFRVDAWETTYLHLLQGDNAVLEWVKGTALRPVLAALEPDEGTAFLHTYGERLLEAYPRAAHGTLLPFKRVFFAAQNTGASR